MFYGKYRERVWLMLLLFLLPAGIMAGGDTDTKLQWLGYSLDEKFVTLNFSIPFDGMVELQILDAEEKLVWRDQKVKNRGENKFRFKRSAFSEGGLYIFKFNYKKEVFQEKLTIGGG